MTIKQLEKKAQQIREDLIKMLYEAGSGHSAGPLDLADIFTALYFEVLNHDPKRPMWDLRDRLMLSCGHVCPIRYTTMIHAGYLPKKYLKTLRKLGSPLQGHPSFEHWPALEHSSGPLGQGISVAVGKALTAKMDKKKHFVYCITSDGEHEEGQLWEAVMFAGKNKLNNLINIIDRNNIQIDGYTEDIMPLEPLREKYEAFNWHVLEIDGHNMQEIIDACNFGKSLYEKPLAIIAHTVAGKGVSYMEYDFNWHGKPPKSPKELKQALHDIRTLKGKIRGEHE